jgi:SAM-dependent methyltransferase
VREEADGEDVEHERHGQAREPKGQAAGRLLPLQDERRGEDRVREQDHHDDARPADRGADREVDDGPERDADAGEDHERVHEEEANSAGHRSNLLDHAEDRATQRLTAPAGARSHPPYTSRPVSDLPFNLPSDAATRLRVALDRERKIDHALEALGPIAGRDVLVVGGGPDELARYAGASARVTPVELADARWPIDDGSIDTILSVWSGFRGIDRAALEEVDRVLRPEGRLLVVHDYGRDDVSRLRGELPEYGAWSRRDGPFLATGFRVRVVHCFWTFDEMREARSFLESAFGEAGSALGAALKRPRLSYNVAIYHRTRGAAVGDAASTAVPVRENGGAPSGAPAIGGRTALAFG